MKSLIIGYKGFVGPHLEKELRRQHHDVITFDLKTGHDLRRYEQIRTFLDAHEPDYIFNLAGLAYVGESQLDPHRAIETHITATVNLLEAVKALGLRPKILLASTAEEYGYSYQQETVTERSPTIPENTYGVTKHAMQGLARVYHGKEGLHVVVTRAFNHIGPGKGEAFADSSFAKRIVQIERGELDVLRHGNLEAVRNYTDVKDIAAAYVKAINASPGVYNVCSDTNIAMVDLLDMMIGMAQASIPTEVDERLYRKGGDKFQPPSYQKLKQATGWEPLIPLKQSVEDTLNDWRRRLI